MFNHVCKMFVFISNSEVITNKSYFRNIIKSCLENVSSNNLFNFDRLTKSNNVNDRIN